MDEGKKIRGLMITPDYPPQIVGGCALSCQLIVEGLRSRGIHMDVLAFNGDKREEVVTPNGFVRYFPHHETLLGLNYAAYEQMRHLPFDYDIVHVYNCQQMPAAVIYAHARGAKVVATLNNMVPVCTNPSLYNEGECRDCGPVDTLNCALKRDGSVKMRAFMPVHWTQFQGLRRYAKRVDAFIALSEETKRYYVQSGFPKDRIHVIPNMFDPKVLEMASRSSGSKPSDHQAVIYVGRLEVEKGLQTLIEALSIMDRKDVRLYLVGKGAYEQELRQLTDRLGLKDQVEFPGFMPHERTAEYYRKASVFVHPALWPEPFARTLLESLAFKVPLLVSDNGPSAQILGSAAESFPSGDAGALARALEGMISDKARLREMVEHGQVVLDRYSPKTVMDRVEDLYRGLV